MGCRQTQALKFTLLPANVHMQLSWFCELSGI